MMKEKNTENKQVNLPESSKTLPFMCVIKNMANGHYFRKRRNGSLINLINADIWHLCKHRGPNGEYMAFCKAISMREGGSLAIYNLSRMGGTNGIL